MGDESIRKFERELLRSGFTPRDIALGLLRFYVLRWSDYESSQEYWFASTVELGRDKFRELTDSLLPEASAVAIASAAPPHRLYGRWVGWDSVVESMVALLEARGFYRLKDRVRVTYAGPSIVRSEDGATHEHLQDSEGNCIQVRLPATVIAHNLRVETEIDDRRAAARAARTEGDEHGS